MVRPRKIPPFGVVFISYERSSLCFVSETTERPQWQVRRDAVLDLVPDEVPRTAAGLAAFFGISRTSAWRLFLASPAKSKGFPQLGGDNITAISAALPEAKFNQLFARIDTDTEQVAS